ncbi:unnamed protein product [Schistosoma margrebowiei]|uniref:Uncharacterized protein n=1 Tax=Schistosoma margrebowiei TaxID=48269 RepID=A0A183MS04_9TREM|nr:unnamed protein product [Schistosoma margrebowiei]
MMLKIVVFLLCSFHGLIDLIDDVLNPIVPLEFLTINYLHFDMEERIIIHYNLKVSGIMYVSHHLLGWDSKFPIQCQSGYHPNNSTVYY